MLVCLNPAGLMTSHVPTSWDSELWFFRNLLFFTAISVLDRPILSYNYHFLPSNCIPKKEKKITVLFCLQTNWSAQKQQQTLQQPVPPSAALVTGLGSRLMGTLLQTPPSSSVPSLQCPTSPQHLNINISILTHKYQNYN